MRTPPVWLVCLCLSGACGQVGFEASLDAALPRDGAMDASADVGDASSDTGPDPRDASLDAIIDSGGSVDSGPAIVAPGGVRLVSSSADGSPFSASEWSILNGGDLSNRGEFIAFNSELTDLVAGDTNGQADVFVLDTAASSVERIDFTPGGQEPNGESYVGAISPDARYVVMGTTASRFVPGDTGSLVDVVLADRVARTVETISVSSSGELGNGNSNVRTTGAVMSNDARFVVFTSSATNLGGTGATGGRTENAFVRDRLLGTTTCLSCLGDGAGAAQGAGDALIAGDGRFAFFSSSADTLLGASASTASTAIFRRDLTTNELLLVSRGLSGEATDPLGKWSTTDDGSLVAFQADPGPGFGSVSLLYNVPSGTTQLVSVDEGGAEIRNNSTVDAPSLSSEGRYLAFPSGGAGFRDNVFVRDFDTGRVRAVGQREDGVDVDGYYFTLLFDPTSTVVLVGTDEPLSSADSNDAGDLYLRGLPL